MADYVAADTMSPSDQSLVDKFKTLASQFAGAYSHLSSKASLPMDAKTRSEYNALMSSGNTWAGAIQTAANAVDTFNGWLKEWFGLGAFGVVPLVPIALIAAATAFIVKWLADATVMMKRLALIEGGNITPEQAEAMVNAETGSSFTSQLGANAGKVLALAAVGVVGYLWFTSKGARR